MDVYFFSKIGSINFEGGWDNSIQGHARVSGQNVT